MVSEWLIRAFVARPSEIRSPRIRGSYGVLEGWVSIVVNLIVFVVKLIPGIIIGSISLIADAFHSLGDVASSILVIWGFKISAKPSDKRHPFGHGRVESIAALVIGIMLFVVAWEFAQNSVIRLLHPKPVTASLGLLALLVVTLVLKEWLSRFALVVAKTIGSSALQGDAWHHRSDVFATAVVIVSLIAARFGVDWVDGVGGLAVAGFIAALAYRLTRDAVNPLLGEAPSPQLLSEIRETALAVPEVDEIHDVIVHFYGSLLLTSLHVEIPSELDVTRAHDVAEAVETALNERFGGWSVVHIDPVNRRYPLYPAVWSFLKDAVPTIQGAEAFDDLRIVGAEDPCYVIFDLKAEGGHAQTVASQLRDAVESRFPEVAKVVVNIDPRYVY
ncbi:MAG TPA: cation diffusion facilitator family transporter [Thermoanaerobaculaceae bacterium]|nr:cation diffusion facilitator family transporter [Thermoanaerobaculaceae bacterium]